MTGLEPVSSTGISPLYGSTFTIIEKTGQQPLSIEITANTSSVSPTTA
jgi:hypothetical protein